MRSSFASVSLIAMSTALGVATPAAAQTQPAPAPSSSSVEPTPAPSSVTKNRKPSVPAAERVSASADIVVTGSRIMRNGAKAPTPVTVLSREEIQQRNPTNVADYLNQLPQFGIGNTPRTTLFFANATGGANQLNLRGLGVIRTLTLLDGRRVVGSGLIPSVDVNLLPQNLVQRVDVVTGGASAAYGSDAVAGVVNFILDTKFTGLRGTVNYGITGKGDGQTITGDLAYGTGFDSGRGHVLLSALYYKGNGIDSVTGRDWYRPGWHSITNPARTATNGQPGQIVLYDVGYTSTPGGVIASGPLKGTEFLPNGIGQFTFGPIQQGQLQQGGTLEDPAGRWGLLPDEKHWDLYGRVNHELTSNINAIFEASYGASNTVNWSAVYNRQGASALTINKNNPFLPQQVRDAMTGANVTSFKMNRLFYDMINTPGSHSGLAHYDREQDRLLGALEGSFLKTGKWRAYYQRGHSTATYLRDNNIMPARFNQAIDAVPNPTVNGVPGVATGAPVCRSTLTNSTNGCVPLNPFGEGNLGASAIAWVTGESDGLHTRQDISFHQNVWSLDAQYEPFSTWAGPVSIAAGAEYRTESFAATADPTSIASQWNVGNYKPGSGSYHVKEFFGEALVPLLRNSPLGQAVDVNGAIRRTIYSTSGPVTTWKAGLTWDFGGLRLRGTRSRDIRAPNLGDLFAPGSQFVNAYLDRTQPNSPQVPNFTISGGNPKLTPEIAKTWTAGFVLQPHAMPGFTLSVDWYDIKIKDAILSLGAQTIIDQCYGYNRPQNPAACQSIVLAPGATNLVNATIYTGGINAQQVRSAGIDYEASYQSELSRFGHSLPGAINLRLLVQQGLKNATTLAGDVTPATLGTTAALKWTGILTSTYALGPSRTTLTARYLGPGKLTNYPATSALGFADDVNHVDPVFYFDVAENYDVHVGSHTVTLFGVVENLFDRAPEPIPGGYLSFGSNAPYDLLGRSFRAGLRFKY